MGTIIVGGIVLLVIGLIVRNIINSKKNGKSINGCCGDCGHCKGHCN